MEPAVPRDVLEERRTVEFSSQVASMKSGANYQARRLNRGDVSNRGEFDIRDWSFRR